MADEYWTSDIAIGEATLQRKARGVRLKIHTSEEKYSWLSQQHEIVPLHAKGQRVYVMAKPYILEPEISITVGLYEPRVGKAIPVGVGKAIGEVIGSQWEGMRHRDIGDCQGWYYREDDVLILWECYVEKPYRATNPLDDGLLRLVWEAFEGFLVRLSGAGRVCTPSWEPIYERSLWQEFLVSVGYGEFNDRAFVREVTK